MTLFLHGLRQNRFSILIWSGVISFMLAITVIIYPEMSSQMGQMNEMLSDMGSFSSAFGMDKINFGEFSGYFGIECGNVLGLGGAFYAAIMGISALSKEQSDNTADFLLTHPISRTYVLVSKLFSTFAAIVILNVVTFAFCSISILIIGESIDFLTYVLIFLSYLLVQIEISAVTFAVSAFTKRSGFGIALGIAFVAYFINIMSNLTESLEPVKYLTPFSFADTAQIITNTALPVKYLAAGAIITIASIALAFIKYTKKDIL